MHFAGFYKSKINMAEFQQNLRPSKRVNFGGVAGDKKSFKRSSLLQGSTKRKQSE
jgi:hypothetical protein